ncbi:endonuclease/exonuclease/phosphatase family protein [bacterium]|nr:endonuclease/exonuclease/phosphatase family protein [bacterium]
MHRPAGFAVVFLLLAFVTTAFTAGCTCGDDDDDGSGSPPDDDALNDDATDDDTGDDDSLDDDSMDDDAADDDTVDDDAGDDDSLDDDMTDDDTADDDSADDDIADDDTGDDDTLDDDTADDDTGDDDTSDDDTGDDDIADTTITIMTMNLQTPFLNFADPDDRLQMVADVINDRQPDFVGVQEAAELLFVPNRAPELAALTGYDYIYKETHNFPLLFKEGIAIFSRWPILWDQDQWLPHPEFLTVLRRAVLGVRADTPWGEMYFYDSHFTIDDRDVIKADQALTAFEFIEQYPSPIPSFFAGDLNCEPDRLAMEFLRGETIYQGRYGNFVDAWLELYPHDVGYTYPADDPEKRIDYVYAIPGNLGEAVAMECEHVLDAPDAGLWASDHIGVICEFEWAP